MKKISKILLTIMLLFGMCSLFAEELTPTITINNALCYDDPYNLYTVFNIDMYERYKINYKWVDFFETGAGKDFVTLDENGFITSKNDEVDLEHIAQEALEYVKTNSIDAYIDTNESDSANCLGETAKFEVPSGYYLLESPKGKLATFVDVNPEVTINEKNIYPVVDLLVNDGKKLSNNMDITLGDRINYVINVELSKGINDYLYIEDVPDTGIRVDTSSIEVEGCDEEDYQILLDNFQNSKAAFAIKFNKDFLNSVDDDDTKVQILFSADSTNLMEVKAIGIPVRNHVEYVFYESGSKNFDSANVYIWRFNIYSRFYTEDEKRQDLPNVHYHVSKSNDGSNPISFVDTGDKYYRVATSDDSVEDKTTDLFNPSDDNPVIQLSGLDSGKYYVFIDEIPYGYSKITNPPVEVEVKYTYDESDDSFVFSTPKVYVDYLLSAFNLPSTGGSGTTILITIGLVTFILSLSIIITKLRIKNN